MTPAKFLATNARIELAGWVTRQLSILNSAAENGNQAAAIEILNAGQRLARAATCAASRCDPRDNALMIGDIGMIVSSLLRHGIEFSNPGLGKIVGALECLSYVVDHPPRESIYTYILWNGLEGTPPRVFTDNPLEKSFISLTRAAVGYYDEAATLLRNVDLSEAAAVTRIVSAQRAFHGVLSTYIELTKVFRSEPPDWFRKVYKPYFPAYPVKGLVYDPPSGAHGAGVIELDCLFGTLDHTFLDNAQRRMRHLTTADQGRICRALECGSLSYQLEANANISREVLVRLSETILLFARTSALHWGLIQKLLVGSGEANGSAAKSARVMSYEDVLRLVHLRRHAPILALIAQRLTQIS